MAGGGILWDDVAGIFAERLGDPIRAVANSVFGLILTAVDLVLLAVTTSGNGGGVIESTLVELRGRIETEREGLNNEIGGVVADGVKSLLVQAAELAGIHLDPDEPLSAESISEVVSQLVGYDFENVFDPELLKRDLIGLASQKVEEQTGIPIDLEDQESIANFSAALLLSGIRSEVEGQLSKIDISAICPAVNTVASVLCKTQNCHPCMEDEADCKERRERQKRNRGKYEKVCSRVKR